MNSPGRLLLLIISIGIAWIAARFLIHGIKSFVLRKNVNQALLWIRARQWGELRTFITLKTIRWRYAGKKYVVPVGWAARKRLGLDEASDWWNLIQHDSVLRGHINAFDFDDPASIEKYLAAQYSADTSILPPANAVIVMVASIVAISIALVIAIIATGSRAIL